jgi:protein O-GlcNAc transferase
MVKNQRKRNLEKYNKQLKLGRQAYKAGDYQQAIIHLKRAATMEPRQTEPLMDLGRLYYETAKWEEARNALKAVLAIDFSHPEALKGLGFCLDLLGKPQEAIYYYLRCIEIRPDDPVVHDNLITALLATGKMDDAISAANRAIERFPQYAQFSYRLAQSYFESGQIEKANAAVEDALKKDSQSAEIYLLAADIAKAGANLEAAMHHVRYAIKLEPENGHAHLRLSQMLNETNSNEEYLQEAQKARKIFESTGDKTRLKYAYWDEGWACYKLDKFPESINASKKALKLDKSLAPAAFNIGLALLRMGRHEEALTQYRKAITMGDGNSLKADGIDDLTAALTKYPNLRGGRRILQELQKKFEQSKGCRSEKYSQLMSRMKTRKNKKAAR